MTDGDALLRAIRTHPDEDTPRLVYADWLDEQGETARAEFVRVQVELARMFCSGCGDGFPCRFAGQCCKRPKQNRERELLINFPAGWPIAESLAATHPHRDITRAGEIRCHGYDVREMRFAFRRGFAEEATCEAADFLRHSDGILAAHPVRAVKLTTHPTITVKYEDPEEQYVLGWQIGDRWYGAHHVRCVEKKHFADRMERFVLAVLWCRCPGIVFELPAIRLSGAGLADPCEFIRGQTAVPE